MFHEAQTDMAVDPKAGRITDAHRRALVTAVAIEAGEIDAEQDTAPDAAPVTDGAGKARAA